MILFKFFSKNIIGSILLELKNIDPKYMNGDVIERLVALKTEIDTSISKKIKTCLQQWMI